MKKIFYTFLISLSFIGLSFEVHGENLTAYQLMSLLPGEWTTQWIDPSLNHAHITTFEKISEDQGVELIKATHSHKVECIIKPTYSIFSISSINTNNVFKKTFYLLDNTLLIDYNKGYLSEPFHIQFLEKNGFARSDWWFILSDGPPIIEITVHYKNKEGDFVPGQGKVILTKNFKK